MNHPSEPTDKSLAANGEPANSGSIGSRALDRRRLLLKGLGRGGALLGATVPLKTLASTRVITFESTQCTVSGMQSGIHSAAPGTPVCSGLTTSSWGASVGNFGISPSRSWPVSYLTPCKTIFTRCTLVDASNNALSLFAVVNKYPTSNDAHWVCAWLNAQASTGMNFPYTKDQVLAYYNLTDLNALAFFKKYTERV